MERLTKEHLSLMAAINVNDLEHQRKMNMLIQEMTSKTILTQVECALQTHLRPVMERIENLEKRNQNSEESKKTCNFGIDKVSEKTSTETPLPLNKEPTVEKSRRGGKGKGY